MATPVLDLEVRAPEVRRDRVPDWGGRIPGPPGTREGNGDGERAPGPDGPPLSNSRLAMLMLLGGESMFFGGLVLAFLQLRLGAAVWPPTGQPRLPIGLTAVNTLVLLASSWTLVRALRAVRAGDQAGLVRRLAGTWGLGAGVLFAILFLWQLPHTLAIARLYRDDYARAGIRVLPVVDPDGGSTERQIVTGCLALHAVALLPTLVGLTGGVYFFGALLLGALFLVVGMAQALRPSAPAARRVLLASVIYLPVLLALMALDKVG